MKPFFTKFKELASTETRLYNTYGDDTLPDGSYAFLESFCEKPHCDCCRVIISVFCVKVPDKMLATISYGWREESFYSKFLKGGEFFFPEQNFKGPYLDPLNPQSEYSEKFLSIFKGMIEDEAYVERIVRHYAMFKKAVSQKGQNKREKKSRPKKLGNKRKPKKKR